MPDAPTIFVGRWRVIRELGKGGQGVVYEVVDTSGLVHGPELALKIRAAVTNLNAIGQSHDRSREHADVLVSAIRDVIAEHNLPRAALKQMLPIDQAVNAQTALERMTTELHVLKAINHSSLIKVLDDKLEESWFVTEYFKNGTLGGQLDRHQGRVLDALRAIRPIVDAVTELHKAGIVHRDIKPDNVFVADDGHLVLGDCGLAIKLETAERLTMTFENVGTRDYQPPWSYGMRLEDVKPTFDVFSLGKLLWAMVSGQPKFPLWYFDKPQHDVRRLFPEQPEMSFVRRILVRSVVQEEEDCKLTDATALRDEVDEAIRALEAGGQVPRKAGKMLCRFCGLGCYERFTDAKQVGFTHQGDALSFWRCSYCGHMESFLYRDGAVPKGWIED